MIKTRNSKRNVASVRKYDYALDNSEINDKKHQVRHIIYGELVTLR